MRTPVLGAMLLALTSLACDNSVGPLKSNVQVSFATRSSVSAAAPTLAPTGWRAASNDTVTTGADTIVITKAQLVLRQIELKTAQTDLCGSGTGGECPEIELGPVLVDLPLVPGAQQQFGVTIPAGSYSEVDFEIYKVTPQDPAALQVLLDRSLHVEGTYNHQSFTFESSLDVEQELVMMPALVVTDTAATNITIQVSLDRWFRDVNSGALLDPREVANRSAIEEAIKVSLKAFKDDDHDGQIDP